MADRNVKVRLIADVSNYLNGVQQAADKTREVGSEAEKLAQKKEAFNLLGTAALGFGTVAAAGVGLAVAKFAEFDAQMSSVQAATHESTENMERLRAAAIKAGADTVYSATEAAQAEEELSKAGVSTANILSGGLNAALSLASAGQLEVARAAEITATALSQYGLKGEEAGHVSDLLAAGAGKAQGSVEDLAQGLKYVGPVAAQMGVSIDDTVGVLAELANQGILADQAGTGLRGVMLSLTAPTKAASKAMEEYGINAFDAQGNFVGLSSLAGQLHDNLSGLDEATRSAALGQIFGNEQITAARILYSGGSEAVKKWTGEVNDTGYAALTAAQKMDNLQGDVEALSGSFDTALIQSGSAANEVLREIVQTTTEMVNGFSRLPQPVQGGVLAVGAVAAAASLASGALLIGTPKIAEYRTALKELSPNAQKAAGAIMNVGKAAGVAGAFFTLGTAVSKAALALAGVQTEADSASVILQKLQETGDYNSVFKGLTTDTNSLNKALNSLLSSDFDNTFNRFGSDLFSWTGATSQVQEFRDQFANVGQSFAQLVQSGNAERAKELFGELAAEAAKQGYSTKQVMDLLPAYKDALADASNEQTGASATAQKNAQQLAVMSGAAENAGQQVSDLADKIKGFGSATLDAREANRQFQAAIDDLQKSIADNGTTLDDTTEKGRANEAALDDIAQSAINLAAATYTQTGSQEEASAALADGRQHLIDMLGQFGITGQAAEDYADKLGLIPANIPTVITANTAPALAEIGDFIRTQTNRQVTLLVNTAEGPVQYRGGVPGGATIAKAAGGLVTGPGTGTSDSIAARLSNGEYVMTAAATRKFRPMLDAMNYGSPSPTYVAPTGRYATGGPVSPVPAAPVYVQNPFTGEYLLAQVAGVAESRVAAGSESVKASISTGKQKGAF